MLISTRDLREDAVLLMTEDDEPDEGDLVTAEDGGDEEILIKTILTRSCCCLCGHYDHILSVCLLPAVRNQFYFHVTDSTGIDVEEIRCVSRILF